MSKKIRSVISKGKLKIIDLDGTLIDSLNPIALEDTLDILQLKYGKKRRKRNG